MITLTMMAIATLKTKKSLKAKRDQENSIIERGSFLRAAR